LRSIKVNRDVRITLSGTQRDKDGNETVTRCRVSGQYFERNGGHYLLYEEQCGESETMTRNTLKIRDNILELTRKGAVSSHMLFEAGMTHPGDYTLPYGSLSLKVHTEDLKCLWAETEASIHIDYCLWTAGELLSKNKLHIKIKNFLPED